MIHTSPPVATVTTLNTSVRNTLSFVGYHLNSGVKHMYLFFDDPQDPAITYLNHNDCVTSFRCDKTYWNQHNLKHDATIQEKQMVNATFALELSKKSAIEWLLHLDSDELCYSKEGLEGIFSNIPDNVDIIRFPVLEAVPQNKYYKDPFSEIRLFKSHLGLKFSYDDFIINKNNKTMQRRKAKFWYRRKKLYSLIYNLKNSDNIGTYLLGHTNGKAATRTSLQVEAIGNHIPVPIQNSQPGLMVSQTGYILHYDCQGYGKWKDKWESRINGSARFDTDRFSNHRREQLQLFISALKKGESHLDDLYKKLYYLSFNHRIMLRSLGLLKHIRHNNHIFQLSG